MPSSNVIFLGSTSVFSKAVLAGLSHVDLVIEGVYNATYLPIVQPNSLESIAFSRHWPVRKLGLTDNPERYLTHWLQNADVVLIACYPRLLSASLLASSPGAVLNLHPSLLPHYRGPAPLFWQLHHGETQTGVSLHRVIAQPDAGPIVAQTKIPLAPEIREPQLAQMLGQIGAHLFMKNLNAIVNGTATYTAQNEHHASYFSWPQTDKLTPPIP